MSRLVRRYFHMRLQHDVRCAAWVFSQQAIERLAKLGERGVRKPIVRNKVAAIFVSLDLFWT